MKPLGLVVPALLCTALSLPPAHAAPPRPSMVTAAQPLTRCPTSAATQRRAELDLVRAVQSAQARDVRRSVTWANLCQLNADQRAELMLDVLARNNVAVLKAVVRAGMSPNQVVRVDREGEWVTVTALNAAIILHAEPDLALALIELGADANARSIDDNPPLFSAVAARKPTLVSRLLRAGAAPNAGQVVLGATPLMAAVARTGEEQVGVNMAEELLAHGADINRASDTGYTPLMVAARIGNRQMVDWLLGKGADPSRSADDGHTYLSVLQEAAKPNSWAALAQLLDTLNGALKRP
jgi:Ankyrin repeats (3 copies)